MDNTSNSVTLSRRDVFYQRQRTKHRFFAAVASFFEDEAKQESLTKREIARRLSCDPAQITRWLQGPTNITADGISDLLFSMGAEAELKITRFRDYSVPNEAHPLIEAIAAIPEVASSVTQTAPLRAMFEHAHGAVTTSGGLTISSSTNSGMISVHWSNAVTPNSVINEAASTGIGSYIITIGGEHGRDKRAATASADAVAAA